MEQVTNANPNILTMFYISTGQCEVFYTLRSVQIINGVVFPFSDTYIQNLSIDEDEAIKKAEAYVEKLKQLMPNSEFTLDCEPENRPFIPHGLKLRPFQVQQMYSIYNEKMPFGKHEGKHFDELPVDYMLWAVKSMHENLDPVKRTLSSALFAKAIELGHINTAEDVEEALNLALAKKAQESKSEYVGNIKDRILIEAEILTENNLLVQGYNGRDTVEYKCTLISGENKFFYKGSKYLGKVGETIKIKVTITHHFEMNGIKFTRFNRPALA